jgi:hypothetical protein
MIRWIGLSESQDGKKRLAVVHTVMNLSVYKVCNFLISSEISFSINLAREINSSCINKRCF